MARAKAKSKAAPKATKAAPKATSGAKAASKAKAAPKPKAKAAPKSKAKGAPAKKGSDPISAPKSQAKATPAKKASDPISTSAPAKTKKGSDPISKKPAAAKKRASIARPTYHAPSGPAKQRLRDALAWVEDFVVECQRLTTEEGPLPWEHADTLELVGFERWGTELAKTDREAGVCALVLAAQLGFPQVLAAGGAELESMGFRGDEVLDGASVESQLDRCARWVDDPSEANRQAVEDGFDPSRQLHTWDPDLEPHDTKSFFWYYEIGQLASAAIVKGDGDAASTSYYYWPGVVSVGRGLVVAVRGLRTKPEDVPGILRDVAGALSS